MSKKLTNALKVQRKQTKQVEQLIYGSLGIPLNGKKLVEVPGRNSYVYVKLRDNQNEVIQAFNNKVAASYDLPVILRRESSRYIVDGVNTMRYNNNLNNFASYLPKHGQVHSFFPGGGGDVVWTYSRQIMPLLVYPSPSNTGTNVSVYGQPLLINNQWQYVGETGTANLLTYVPTGSNSVMGLIYLDTLTGNPGILINSGTPIPNSTTGTGDVMPYIPVPNLSTQIPLAGVKINTGTSVIGWDSLYDMRQFFHVSPSGTSSGGGGGGTTVVTQPVPVFNQGQFVVSGTAIRLDGNVNVTASGTQAVVSFPVTTYFRVGQPVSLSTPTGLFWKVPDGVYASGSLGVFVQGHALIPGIDYNEQIYVSGTYSYTSAQSTGSYHLVHYGVPCVPQIFILTGTSSGITDSNGIQLVDSNGIQLVDSNGN